MKNHVCRERRTCSCYPLALEPDENCPVHGYPWPPRCTICGRFMKWPKFEDNGYLDEFDLDDLDMMDLM